MHYHEDLRTYCNWNRTLDTGYWTLELHLLELELQLDGLGLLELELEL